MESIVQELNIQTAIEQKGIDHQGLLGILPAEASRLLKLTPTQTAQLYKAASIDHYAFKTHCIDLSSLCHTPKQQQQSSYITTLDPHIDDILGKGIPLGSITEVVGESSSGKTQFGLHLCFTVQLPEHQGGLGGEAVYLYNEGKFSTRRCVQLANGFSTRYQLSPATLTQAIHTMYVPTTEEFYRTVAYHLPVFLERNKKVKLVVIDSIGSAYRGCGQDKVNYFDTLQELCEVGSKLKSLAYQYQVAIVAINQVSDTFAPQHQQQQHQLQLQQQKKRGNRNDVYLPPHTSDWLDIRLEGNHRTQMGTFIHSLAKKPILGLTWSNSVTTRIRMARSFMSEGRPTQRALLLEFSPLAPRRGCEIIIDEKGIHSAQG